MNDWKGLDLNICAARDCANDFLKDFPRQVYCTVECREREQVKRLEETKAERALEAVRAEQFRQHMPSVFFDGSKRNAVILDIRFEIEEDKMARSGTDECIAARVRGLAEAKREGDSDAVYGAYIQLAAAAGAAAIRANGHLRRARRGS